MNKPVLEMRQATFRCDTVTLLADINFTLAAGEILGVAGSNGAGKSSLLRMACNEQSLSDGKVFLNDQDIAAIKPRDRARRMAVLPQYMGLQFDFTVRQVIALGRAPHGERGAADEDIIDYLLDACELQGFAQRNYQSLSGGEKQRTQFARVLAQLLSRDPQQDLQGQVLILDEPTAALDVRYQEQLVHMLKTLRDRGCAVLLVMHDINLLSRCADRLLFLKEGRVHSLAPTAAQLNERALSELFEFPIQVQPRGDGELPFVHPDPASYGA